jgi:hypothetical protein
MRAAALFVAWFLVATTAAGQIRTREVITPDVTVLTFRQIPYGSLEFDGNVERVDFGDECEYRVTLDVTFHANAKVNKVSSAQLRWVQLLAVDRSPTEPGGPKPRAIFLREPIYVTLTRDGERQPIRPVTFRLGKTVEASSDVMLAVLSDKLLWPISGPLR